VDAQTDAATTKTGSGSYLPELAGGAVVLGLSGLAGFTAWQRKRAG
jgi:LPXTG-motif cell wall-anchored protein